MKRTLASLIAVSTLLAACAEDAAPLNPRDVVLDAVQAVYEADSLHQELEMEIAAAGERYTFSGDADVDNANQEAAMTLDLGLLGGEMEMVMADGVVYMRSPVFQGAGTEWVSIDPTKLSPKEAAQFGGFGAGTTDPSAYAGLFAGVFDVEAAGEQEIDGVPTTHYTGTIDLARVLENFADVAGEEADEATREQLVAAVEQFETLGVEDRIRFHLWVDEEGFPRRQRITMDFGELVPGDEDATMDMTVDYSAFGEPVEIEVPPASRVTDMTEAIGAMGAMGGA
ncbi:MAG TPA: LppX_LprAFG lipoprotein [Actinomycetota bacterium]|nr:LppX_LprAFG lipoprotein [Actinomycetota bacterium]